MNSENNSSTSLFLMELIITIFFFSLASAVSIRLFVSAHTLAKSSTALSNATVWAQSLSEAFYGCKGDVSKIAELFPNSYEAQDTIMLFFDDYWNILPDSHANASYEALLVTKKADAATVYADVPDYGTNHKGKAITGNIAIIDIRDMKEIPSNIPADDKSVIIGYSVDTLID